jgi:hypothetical protein
MIEMIVKIEREMFLGDREMDGGICKSKYSQFRIEWLIGAADQPGR